MRVARMDRVAVFVDAGYLFAQGSTALSGSKKARIALIINAPHAIDSLKTMAEERASGCRLLRVYWYDGAIGGARPTTDQALLANLNDVKLRLGFVNSLGQQKGVDSLIVTDLIELARLGSITDAVVLSGDEDIRVGVQIAQNYGVRVHLLGIVPSRGSQSNQLLQEADTTAEWSAETIHSFLSIREDNAEEVESVTAQTPPVVPAATPNSAGDTHRQIEATVRVCVEALSAADLQGITAYWKTDRGVPSDLDRKMLPRCGAAIGRKMERDEIKHMRSCFRRLVSSRLEAPVV